MNISLTPELENRIKSKVETGLYNNASEVVREALRFVEIHEDWVNEIKLSALRQKLNVGLQQLDNGEGKTISSPQELDTFFQKIKQI
ncbi:MAG: type II toxin-antitoxin system ParD family antitoxin [Hydrogenovibrio sp.]|uniref:type II toxin-antitoxin system ParD family antitoxin n=1 Tax=Hydrogenovibrio sp. TaxID=2065821 RepID=UPI00287090F0|nr:type II toxin-antitoxin system ParD family antitoxin [Hydrogenovibrio sp.]MDR9498835.1 type II toxin-antitoxin system ParD family antitoxin [Hydrogenovibrio sp.]